MEKETSFKYRQNIYSVTYYSKKINKYMIKSGVILMCITMTVNNRYDLNGHLKKMLNIAYRMKFMSVIFCCSHSKQTGTCRC